MQIYLKKKSEKKKNEKKKISKNYIKIFLQGYFLLTLIVGSLAMYYVGTSWKVESIIKEFKNSITKAGRYEMIYLPKILFGSFLNNFNKVENLNINLKFEAELTLENNRKRAIAENGLNPNTTAREVNFTIQDKNKILKGKIRLKGGRNAHWNEKKYSTYKIDLDANQYFMGMNKFSISKPRMRNYIHEWLYHEMGKELGLINLNYKFINVSINGSKKRLYALEEGFSKELIERSKRRNGPIFSLREELSMEGKKSVVEIYNKKYWNTEENYKLAEEAANKLNKFFLQKEKAENVFDLDKWATLLAICDYLKTFHGAQQKSVKFYYNPINGLFEPVLYDGHRGRQHPNYNKWNYNYNDQIIFDYVFKHSDSYFPDNSLYWTKLFFVDYKQKDFNKKFYKLYLKKLNKISSEKFINNFYYSREKEIKKINNQIYSDYYLFDNNASYGPGFYYFSKQDFFQRAGKLRKKISYKELVQNQRFQVGIIDNELIIKNFNRSQYYGLFEIRTLNCQNNIDLIDSNGEYKIIEYNNYLNYLNKADVKSSEDYDFANVIVKTKIDLSRFENEQLNQCKGVTVYNVLNNTETYLEIDRLNFSSIKENKKDIDKDNYKKHFVEVGKELYLNSDLELINENLFIPEKFTVILKPGQKIILEDNAFIFSKSNWIAKGKEERIYIMGQKDNFGGGLIIDGVNQKSYFENVNFAYLSGLKKDYLDTDTGISYSPISSYDSNSINTYSERLKKIFFNKSLNGFLIMGSLNLHNTEVDLVNVKLDKINSEDAINIINSKFTIKNLTFVENLSDAIDLDFSEGIIEATAFKDIGNDAIDFSGSKVKVRDVHFDNIGDKLISIGENSEIDIKNIIAEKSYIGIASKDGSTAIVENVKMTDVVIPFASYNKKKEYKISKLFLKNVETLNFQEKWIIDKKSKIYYEDKSVGKKTKNILKVVYGEN